MRLCWFDDFRLGVVAGDSVADVTAALDVLPQAGYPPRLAGDLLVAHLDKVAPAARSLVGSARRKPLADVFFRSPVANPTKIIGVPVNYLKHVEEAHEQRDEFTTRYAGAIEEQGLFLKANSALAGFGEGMRIRFPDRRNDHEMELGMVIGRRGSHIAEEDALDHVAGYTIALDFVVRGPEDRSFRKSPDTYAVLGPWLTTADEVAEPQALDFRLKVNGETRQEFEHPAHDHVPEAPDRVGVAVLHAAPRRHLNDRDLRGRRPGGEGRRSGLRDRRRGCRQAHHRLGAQRDRAVASPAAGAMLSLRSRGMPMVKCLSGRSTS